MARYDRGGDTGVFENREHAGAMLGDALSAYRGRGALVLGIPRGGVPVAAEVARRIDADLDVVVARKLGAPGAPELAIGAVAADGERFLNEDIIRDLRVSPAYLDAVTARASEEAHQRERQFRGTNHTMEVRGRVVIVVDDGLATGATMRAAIRSVRRREPATLVVAVPVGARETCDAIRPEVDDLVCLASPEPFFAVGLHYEHFDPTPDADVGRLLSEARRRAIEPKAGGSAP